MNWVTFPPCHLLVQQLRETNQFCWLHATHGSASSVDKAGFHAIGPIGGVDGKQ
jgi:hypothetical protein